ncbi:hypothetical protein AVEN_131074-1 [Araneus ventricosus]|uniref:Uncharacterized protein n=1 Tax=Araneus ventricosus TaxID=182803 RepID=A0A4Y2D2J0_ARAVE|nr:hypothetical protein AVEN_131074-1 [Araneus ventricosus]
MQLSGKRSFWSHSLPMELRQCSNSSWTTPCSADLSPLRCSVKRCLFLLDPLLFSLPPLLFECEDKERGVNKLLGMLHPCLGSTSWTQHRWICLNGIFPGNSLWLS